MALALLERRSHQHDLCIVPVVQRRGQKIGEFHAGHGLRVSEAFHIHAARHDKMVARPADPVFEADAAHALADVHERVGDRHHGALGGEVDEAQHPPHIQEGEDMHPVNDHLHARSPGGNLADDSGLALMGVNEVRPDAAEKPPKLKRRRQILQWVERPHQCFQADALDAGIEPLDHGRMQLCAKDQRDVMAECRLPVAGQQGIFVGAAANETGDDMDDTQRGTPAQELPAYGAWPAPAITDE